MPTSARATARFNPQVQAWLTRVIGLSALLLGCWAAWFYHEAGLTLSHYDTKGHLVVARRVIDSLTPGWRQLGALWLPLPHLLNLIPVQLDAFYRTGASGVALSVLGFGVAVAGVARIAVQATGSPVAGLASACILALNPDLLYLQSTPMTEALLVALMVAAISFTIDWLGDPSPGNRRRAGWTIAALCLTRYEAWPLTAALFVLIVAVRLRQGLDCRTNRNDVLRLAGYPAAAVGAFLAQSRITVGSWFVTDGFFVPDNIDTGRPLHAIASVWWGAHRIAGTPALAAATAGAALLTILALVQRRRAALLAVLALFAVGALPAYAFYRGHPFRIRYMTPLLPALAIYAGLLVGLLPGWWRRGAAALLVALVVASTSPFDPRSPMVLEAQWDTGNAAARRAVTRYLAGHYDGRTILGSMGSLGHFMQESAAAGLDLKDYLHEGNGGIWEAALVNPRPYVGWIVMEEWSEGGDRLANLARRNPDFLAGFERVAEGGGVALYHARSLAGAATQAAAPAPAPEDR
jgi:hypothetical protein